MKPPSFRLAWAMVFVAIAALNLRAIRTWSEVRNTCTEMLSRGPKDPADIHRVVNVVVRADLLLAGALPMGNILAVGLVIHRRRRNRPFLLGFEAFGATVLALYIAGVSCLTYEELRPYLKLVQGPLRTTFGPPDTAVSFLIGYSVSAMILVLPQMTFALIGGFLLRRFRDDRATSPNPVPMGQFRFPGPMLLTPQIDQLILRRLLTCHVELNCVDDMTVASFEVKSGEENQIFVRLRIDGPFSIHYSTRSEDEQKLGPWGHRTGCSKFP